jgi:hypothetical protein
MISVEVFMWAFDLIELNGDDVRRDPLAMRKATLERILARAEPGIWFNEHLDEEDGPLVFHHACKLGETARFSLQFWPLAALDQIEEPRGTGCEAGSRRRLVRQAAAQAAADP